MKNFYKILGVSEDASEKQIKLAFRKLAKEYHPDKNPGDDRAEKKFKECSEAYDILSDPQKKREYDRALHEPPNPFSGFGFDFSSMFGDFGDIFSGRHRSPPRPRENDDLGIRIDLAFWEAVNGCKKEINFVRPICCSICDGDGIIGSPQTCAACAGRGRVEKIQGHMHIRTACRVCRGSGTVADPCSMCGGRGHTQKRENITVAIPPGVDTGQVVRLSGKGSQVIPSIPPGNLMVELRVEQRFKKFQRSDLHVHSEEIINFTRAALGGEIVVETIFGKKKLTIPEGSRDGSTLMIGSAGIKNNRHVGNHYVKLRIDFPSSLTEEQKDLLKKLDSTFNV